jgi:glycosyltransferase involved in cell wall biosynthesis
MRHECDVFVGHGRYANVIGALGALLAGVPIRVAVQHSRLTKPRGLVQHLDAWWGTLGVFTHVVSVGQAAADSGGSRSKRYRRHLSVITNGVGLPAPGLSRSEVRAELGVPDDALVAVHIGRWSAAKNQLTVLEMAARVPQVHFVLAGPMQPACDHSTNVTMVGALDRVALSSLMHAADVMICPSRNEAMPLVLLEGLSTGLAVVASDIPPHREILGSTAQCPAPTDVAKWAERLTALSADPAQVMSERLRATRLAAAYSLDRMVDDYDDLIRRAYQ